MSDRERKDLSTVNLLIEYNVRSNAGRLEDKSAIVRKQALLALASMLTFNPFAPQLPEDRFKATLEEYERKLKVLIVNLQNHHCKQVVEKSLAHKAY